MNTIINNHTRDPLAIKALAAATAAFCLNYLPAHAGPTGGVVMDGHASIYQTGGETLIYQSGEYLSLQWDTFNVGADERVEFVQHEMSDIALNRILDNNASQILGRIDALGHVILVNPNGVFFGRDATVNVGGLVASGLDIDSADFMNGDLVFRAIEGSAGTVVNRGLINAASGGNIALLGKSVTNHGLISAELGHVALAAGAEAVVTFDDSGLIGVRIDRETLASEVGGEFAVSNRGAIEAPGGKILLNASVSADLFSEAVNHGGLNGATEAILHSDGSFSLGAGNGVLNSGVLEVSTDDGDAGYVVLTGERVAQRGTIAANASGDALAGQVYLEAADRIQLGAGSRTEAVADVTSGKVRIHGHNLTAGAATQVETSGHTFMEGDLALRTPRIKTEHLRLRSYGDVRQAGALEVTGHTHLVSGGEGDIRLTHTGNDLNSLTVASAHVGNIVLSNQDDLALGDINLRDSSLRLTTRDSDASVAQLPGTQIKLDSSELYVSSGNITLGESGATTEVDASTLELRFTDSIATHGSIELHAGLGGFYANNARILAYNAYYEELNLDLRGDRMIDLAAEFYPESDHALVLHTLAGKQATLHGGMSSIYQTGPIHLSGALDWRSYYVKLDNPDNDVAMVKGAGASNYNSILRYADSNDLMLGNLSATSDAIVDISSVGAGATIRQAPHTDIMIDSSLTLSADNIILGSKGRSSLNGGVALTINFSNLLRFDGPWSGQARPEGGPYIHINGDDNDNRLEFTQYANSDVFAEGNYSVLGFRISLGGGNDTAIFDAYLPIAEEMSNPFYYPYIPLAILDLGAGNDRVFLNTDVEIPIILGEGNDRVRIWDMDTHYHLLDFDGTEDRFLVANP